MKKENKITNLGKKGRYNVYSLSGYSDWNKGIKINNEMEYELSYLNNLLRMKMDLKEGETLTPTDLGMLKKIQTRIDEKKSILGEQLQIDNKLGILTKFLPNLDILHQKETFIMKEEVVPDLKIRKDSLSKAFGFMFKILILGDYDTVYSYASQAFGEFGEDKGNYSEWNKEIKCIEDYCDLEIKAITSISADYNEMIPMADGIIYFINPLIKEESEIFELVLPIIYSVKMDIPMIVLFYDQNGFLPISTNELLEGFWIKYPNLEAFVNLLPKNFYQALQSLCLAMINGESPLNIDNAWMRFPIFIRMANIYFNNENYHHAAQALRKIAAIAKIYNRVEYLIVSEKAAFLYSKINLYLEASKVLEDIDKQKSLNFKKMYAENIIRKGNLYFNKQDFESAAKQFERAGDWSSIERLESTIIEEAFRLAIISWISACKFENAFRILDNFPHKMKVLILNEIAEKIGAAIDYLIINNKSIKAKEQLNKAIEYYRKEELIALLDEFKPKARKNYKNF